MNWDTAAGLLCLMVWAYMIVGRGGFWLARQRDDREEAVNPARWPRVVVVVPARNEADVVGRSIGSLLQQDYAGPLHVVLVDDNSDDGTAEVARQTAAALGQTARLQILRGAALPPGWTGKLWALQQGVLHATSLEGKPDYLLLTDADIGHSPDNVRSLVARAEQGGWVLVSLMAQLSCANWAERFLIPAFVFFFQMLYPFGWVARPERKIAAGAGGCMLIRRQALERAGGIASVRTEIIDDCALARRLKQQGPIWLGLTRRAQSLRPYGSFLQIGRMISRSAYAQLRYSPLLLAGTVVGMIMTYLGPPLLAVFGEGLARWMGLGAWMLMAVSFGPMLRFYRLSPLWGLALPAIGAAYTGFTVDSAVAVWRGRGGMWKGRVQAMTGNT